MTDLRPRMRRALGYSAMVFAFAGALGLMGAALAPAAYVPKAHVSLALDVFLAVLPTAAMVIMWFKLKGVTDE